MTSTVIKQILNSLLTSLYDIKTDNGYNNTVLEVLDGINTDNTNYPCIKVILGNEEAESYYETGENAVSYIDVWLSGYINSTTNDEREKFIADIKTFIYGNIDIATAVFPLRNGSNYIQDFHIEEIVRGIDMDRFAVRVRFQFTETLIDTSLPEVPTLNLPVSGSTETTLYTQLDWNSSIGSITYDAQIATDIDFGNVIVDVKNIIDTAYTVSYSYTLISGTQYFWRVRARNIYGVSEWSTVFNYTPTITTLPNTPVLVEPLGNTITGSNTVDFVWNISDRSTSYDFQLSTSSSFGTNLINTNVSKSTYEYESTSNTTYYWRTRGKNTLGTSNWASSSVVLNVPVVIPDYRTNLLVEWSADSQITSDANGISSWTDLVSSINASQSTNSNKPVLKTNFKNGKNAVYFNNNNHILSFTEQTFNTYTAFIVYKADTLTVGDANVIIGGSQGDIFSSVDLLGSGYGVGNGAQFRTTAFGSGDTSWNIRAFQSGKLYSNKVEPSYLSSGTVPTLMLANIGKRNPSQFPYKGYVTNIRIYNSILTQSQINIVSDYLNSLYSIY